MRLITLARLTAGAFVFTIGFAYAWFVVVMGGRPLPIPTISQTWTYRPANFLSRQVVISGSVALMILHIAIYHRTKGSQGADLMLLIALIANASLAVVSAVCMDNSSPECLGSILLHDDFAVVYFVLIDIWMAGMLQITPEKHVAGVVAALASVLSKWRYATSSPFSLGEFEWLNVTAILVYLLSYVQDFLGDVQVGVCGPSPEVPIFKRRIWFSLSTASIITSSLTLGSGTILITYQVANARGDFNHTHGDLPEVSSLFVLPPGNSFAHLGGVLGCTMLVIAFFQFYDVYREFIKKPEMGLVMSVLAAVSLSMTLCVSTVEDIDLHYICVGMSFTFFQCFMFWISFMIIPGSNVQPKQLATWSRVLFSVSLVTKIRLAVWDMEGFGAWELADIITIMLFVGAFAWFESSRLAERSFAIYRMESTKPNDDSPERINRANSIA